MLQRPWRTHEHVEIETLLYVDWFNNKRLHGEIGDMPPNECEQIYYRHQHNAAESALSKQTSLRYFRRGSRGLLDQVLAGGKACDSLNVSRFKEEGLLLMFKLMRNTAEEERSQRLRSRAISVALVVSVISGIAIKANAADVSDSQASVDFAAVIQSTDGSALGVGSSTYGANPLSSAAQSAAEKSLDARYVRIPVGYRNGKVTSSAGGTGGTLDVPALVRLYRSWGYRVLVVCGGRTNDVDIQPGDATKIMEALGFDGIDYTTPNEPGNQGKSIQDSIAWANMIYNEGHALNPDFKVWGPVWAWYDRNGLNQFADALGSKLAGLDYHHYAMGAKSLSTQQAMIETAQYGKNVAQLKADLAAKGLNIPVNVDELNFSWRYNDGTPGGNGRFFTSVNTVWMTSAIGQVLQSGGRALPYATQNGPLGVMVEAGNVNPDNRPASSPMPAYWGIASWTGASVWPHYKDAFYKVTSSDPTNINEVYAVNNESGGYNVIVINKSETARRVTALKFANIEGGSFTAYQTNSSNPYGQPGVVASGSYGAGSPLTLTLPAMSVSVVVMKPGAVVTTTGPRPTTTTTTASPMTTTIKPTTTTSVKPVVTTTTATAPVASSGPTNFKAALQSDPTTVVTSWEPPVSGSAITGYQIARDGFDSTGGGAYSTVLPRSARNFAFTLLKPNSYYGFKIRAITASGHTAWVGASVTTRAAVSAPSDFNAALQRDPSKVVTSWSPAVGSSLITGYRIARDGVDSTAGGAYSTVVPASSTTFTFTLLNPSTTYTFTVRAVTAVGDGPESKVSVTTR